MQLTGDDMTILNPDTGKERYLVDDQNEVHDLRSEEEVEKDDEDDPLQDK